MVLETATLRFAFVVMALCLLVLFYWMIYRPTRAPYCGWWCACLACFAVTAGGDLADGTAHQVWATPLANVFAVLGAGCVWAGARSLRSPTPLPWWLVIIPAVAGVASVVDDPADNVWAGGAVALAGVWVLLVLAVGELVRVSRASTAADGGPYRLALRSMTVACLAMTTFYLARGAAYLAAGEDGRLFTVYLGTEAATLMMIGVLATVSVSMSTLSNEQQTAVLRTRAVRDGLTGLLNRSEFLRLAEDELRRAGRSGGGAQLILADLDHFKQVNDVHGHLAGDHALVVFADSCTASVRSTDLVCRFGGEEFMILLVGASRDRAGQVTSAIDERMREASSIEPVPMPTVSYGIATLDPAVGVEQTIAFADAALYRAKAAGRNRAVFHTSDVA